MQTLPRTTYIWLALLVASMLLGPRLVAPKSKPSRLSSPALSGPAFENYLEAERLTRSYYAYPLMGKAILNEAQGLYRTLALKEAQPNLARKALILGSQLGQALDERILKRLPDAEHSLWRALYGKPPTLLPTDAEAQLKAMRLRFLENQALADLYHKQGKTQAAADAEARRDAQAQKVLWRMIPLILGGLLVGIVGLGLLLFAGFVAVRREWHLLGRIPEAGESKLGWGDLLDAFVFYLGIYRAVGLVVALSVHALDLHPARVPLQVALQAGTGALAVLYLAVKTKKRGASLRELGWSRARLGTNILYGMAGYAATLPLTVALGMLSKTLFRHTPNTEPNPILPLLTSSTSLWERGLLFATTSLFAPLFEELFFRGALFTGLRRRYAGVPSILLSALLFAAVHPPQDWLAIFGLGVSFGILRHLRQSIVPGMVAHFLQNTATFLLLSALFGQ